MNLKRGDVEMTRYPHAAGTRGKKRPVVIVQADSYNARLRHAISAILESAPYPLPGMPGGIGHSRGSVGGASRSSWIPLCCVSPGLLRLLNWAVCSLCNLFGIEQPVFRALRRNLFSLLKCPPDQTGNCHRNSYCGWFLCMV